MKSRHRLLPASFLMTTLGCHSTAPDMDARPSTPVQHEAAEFLARYEQQFRALATAAAEADWSAQTHIVAGDDTNSKRLRAANEALAAFTGSRENIEPARRLLENGRELLPLQVRQLETVLFKAASNPGTVPELVQRRIAAEARQTETLYGFKFELDGRELTPNEIDRGLKDERDLARRRQLWEASKTVGPALAGGLEELRALRNETVRALGYPDFFGYMVSEYGMTTAEMAATVQRINAELRPLFSELHTWTRHELARRYGQPVPDLIPAHWLPNRWGQDWSNLVDVEGFDLEAAVAAKGPEWVLRQAERFYVSLGFDPLPASFWRKSSLYPVASDAGYKKNTHASAWHIDLDQDVRSLMSVEADPEWYETTHHELGHIYYYMCYSTPGMPILLREGADRSYHEAVGSLMGLAALQPRFLRASGLDLGMQAPDATQLLLKEALNYVVFIPWSAGTMFFFEKELYHDELPRQRWNARWWELAAKYQGIAPPTERGEKFCDAATKTHINDDPAGYYDYALSFVLLFQLHDHIARKILREDPRDTNYFGRREVGDFLRDILERGATLDGRTLLRESIGSELSAKPMLEYFEPLRRWLVEQNRGRTVTLPRL